jgi:AcrR family transcriptional regulator
MAAKRGLKPVPSGGDPGTVRGRVMEAAFAAFTRAGFAETSTLEIATRARVSKRELYALFGSKQEMLVACINERAKRLKMPADLPELRDRDTLGQTLSVFGAQLLREVSDPTVVAVFRLAISEAVRAPEVGKMLNDVGIETSRGALRELMRRARAAQLLDGEPAELADHFAGLLWGNRMIGLLLDTATRPNAREIAGRAEAATAAFLRAYPMP